MLPASKQLSYRRSLFDVLLTAGGLNGAAFNEADGWQSCAVLMHPGRRIDNPFTLVQSGFFSVLWNLGVKGCAVGSQIDITRFESILRALGETVLLVTVS